MKGPDDIRDDTDHGATELARRALVTLGGSLNSDNALIGEARKLATLRPAMAPITYWVARFIEGALAGGTPDKVAHALLAEMERIDADRLSHARATLATAQRIVTFSWSSTVISLIVGAAEKKTPILVGESRPLFEGRRTADRLSHEGFAVTLATDAALPGMIGPGDLILLGADTLCADGVLVNKSGSYPLALAAREAGAPVWVGADRSKIVPADRPLHFEEGAATDVWPDHPDRAHNPTFETVPAHLVTGYLTEWGAVDRGEIQKEGDRTAPLFALLND